MVLGDRYVLCSDGLVDEVDDTQIELILRSCPNPQQAAEQLVTTANANGGRDNVTVVVVDVVERVATPIPTSPVAPSSAATSRRKRILVVAAVLVLLAGGPIAAVGWYARGGYYVGFNGRTETAHLAVFKGRPEQILWFRPTVAVDSGVERQDVFPSLAEDIDSRARSPACVCPRLQISGLHPDGRAPARVVIRASTGEQWRKTVRWIKSSACLIQTPALL
jgi:hypothetical protein